MSAPLAEKTAMALAACLTRTHSSTLCCYCFLELLDASAEETALSFLSRRRYGHIFLDAIMSFIVNGLDDPASASTAVVCHCVDHRPTDTCDQMNALQAILGASCQFVACVLAAGEGKLRLKERSSRARDGVMWPVRLTSLFPRGIAATTGIIVRACSADHIGPMTLLAAVVFRCRFHVFPVVLDDANRSTITAAINASLIGLHTSAGSAVALMRAEQSLSLLRYICIGPGRCECDMQRFTRGEERTLYASLLASSGLLCDEDDVEFAVVVVARLFRVLGLRDVPAFLRNHGYSPDEPHDTYALLRMQLSRLSTATACLNEHCGIHIHDRSSGRSLPICARCRMVQYCSRQCQRAHWRHTSFPHKKLCAPLAWVFHLARLSRNDADFAARCRAHRIWPNTARRLIDWIKSIPSLEF